MTRKLPSIRSLDRFNHLLENFCGHSIALRFARCNRRQQFLIETETDFTKGMFLSNEFQHGMKCETVVSDTQTMYGIPARFTQRQCCGRRRVFQRQYHFRKQGRWRDFSTRSSHLAEPSSGTRQVSTPFSKYRISPALTHVNLKLTVPSRAKYIVRSHMIGREARATGDVMI